MKQSVMGSLAAVAILGTTSVAWANWEGQWPAIENDASCVIWNDVSQRGSTVTWSGSCVDGKAEGPGIAIRRYFENGRWKESRFEGEMNGGKADGFGVWIGPDGARYEGEWKDGQPNGKGTKTFFNGSRYEGSFHNGEPDGLGTFAWSDGERYEGEFKANQMNGYGVYTFNDGGRYEGEWLEGVKYGQGKRTWADGSQFEGPFVADNPDGNGKCRNAEGQSGACRFSHGKFVGWR